MRKSTIVSSLLALMFCGGGTTGPHAAGVSFDSAYHWRPVV
jgi:hypothetical protein